MTIGEIIREGFHYARTCKSLWLFGFFVGIASGGSSGGGSGGGGTAGADDPFGLSLVTIAVLAIVLALAIAVLIVLRFVSEGALIEGIVRARQGERTTTRDGFRAGWMHWGVLVRIALLYFGATALSVALLAAPAVIASRAFGWPVGVPVALAAVVVGVPWLITLYLIQAFASRIAVLENRHAVDAIRKARLFLHGRIMLGLRLIVAAFVGSVVILFVAGVAIVPLALLLIALVPVLRLVPVLVLGGLVLLPAFYVFAAVLGTFRSSIWTIGYVTQVES